MQALLGGTILRHMKGLLAPSPKNYCVFCFLIKNIYLDYKIKTNKSNTA